MSSRLVGYFNQQPRLGTLSTSDRSLTDAIRRSGDDRPELLGPGGQDDPDRP